jgi:hypothetical protein
MYGGDQVIHAWIAVNCTNGDADVLWEQTLITATGRYSAQQTYYWAKGGNRVYDIIGEKLCGAYQTSRGADQQTQPKAKRLRTRCRAIPSSRCSLTNWTPKTSPGLPAAECSGGDASNVLSKIPGELLGPTRNGLPQAQRDGRTRSA